MRVRSLRWLAGFGIAAIAFGVIGYSVADAQSVEKLPDAEVHSSAEESKPPGWDGTGTHPGQADFDQYCRLCHSMGMAMKTGPGLGGLAKRIEQGAAHEGKSVAARLLEFIKNTDAGNPDKTTDPYFKEVQATVAGPGIQMSLRGGLPESADDRRILNIIDYILRFRDIEFDQKQYLREVAQGRSLVAGETPLEWGAPACAGCHSVGPDAGMLGAGVGPNIGHTYVLMLQRGKDEKNNYTDGLKDILFGENAPKAHHYYADVEGGRPLTDAELKVVATYFEQAARDTGTERDSNYLPIFALLFAAISIILLEPGIVNVLFAKRHREYIDGPYKEEDHHEEPKAPTVNEQTGAAQEPEKTPEVTEQATGAVAETVAETKEEPKPETDTSADKGDKDGKEEDKKEDS